MADKIIKIGEVGVDSGQLLVCDPCYIDSEWHKEDFEDERIYKDIHDESLWVWKKHFAHFESKIVHYKGKTPNQLIAEGTWTKMPPGEAKHPFSYNACCLASHNEGGQLKYRLGHDGVGVCFPSGLGDGTYNVYAHVRDVDGWGERVTKVEIIMIDDDDNHPYDEEFDDKVDA